MIEINFKNVYGKLILHENFVQTKESNVIDADRNKKYFPTHRKTTPVMDLCGAIPGVWTEQSFLSPCQVDTAAGYKNLTERQDLPPRWEEATIPIAFSPLSLHGK